MKIWQVQLWGAGFSREGGVASFELSGVVSAPGVDEAFAAAVALAQSEHPELEQAKHQHRGAGPVINAEEIQEFSSAPKSTVNIVEVHWSRGDRA